MIAIIEWNSRQQFESKKLASEYFNIPITLVNKSIKTNKTVTCKNKKVYRFSESYDKGGTTTTLNIPRNITLPFGKYAGKDPVDVPLGYLMYNFLMDDAKYYKAAYLND